MPKIDKFFSQSSGSTSIDSNSDNMVTAVWVENPTRENAIITVEGISAADHMNVDNVCMAHKNIKTEDLGKPQISIFSKICIDIELNSGTKFYLEFCSWIIIIIW